MRLIALFIACMCCDAQIMILKKKPVAPASVINACAADNGGFTDTGFVLGSGIACTNSGSLNHTAGNLLYVIVTYQATCTVAGTTSVTDTAGDTFGALIDSANDPGSVCVRTFRVASTAGANPNNITVAHATAVYLTAISVVQVSGSSGTLDVSGNGAHSIGATITTNSFNTTTASEIIIGAVGSANPCSACTWTGGNIGASAATVIANSNGHYNTIVAEYRIVSATQSGITAAITNSTPSDMAMLANSFH
jgi:hypothetical protein